MHPAKWDADDCYAEEDAKEDVAEPYPNAANKEPQHVHEEIQASVLRFYFSHPRTKRPQGKHAQLEDLQAEGNADDCYYQPYGSNQILNGNRQSAEDDPNDVAKQFHILCLPLDLIYTVNL